MEQVSGEQIARRESTSQQQNAKFMSGWDSSLFAMQWIKPQMYYEMLWLEGGEWRWRGKHKWVKLKEGMTESFMEASEFVS